MSKKRTTIFLFVCFTVGIGVALINRFIFEFNTAYVVIAASLVGGIAGGAVMGGKKSSSNSNLDRELK